MTGEGSLFDVPPAAIGRFRVLHQLGAGTCGPVFRAVDPESDTTVAIKLFTIALPPGRAGALAEALGTLVKELPRMTAAVTPLVAGLHGHTPFLVTSYAPGDSLDVALKQFGPAMLVDVVTRLDALASALDAAADRRVWHGALHPRDVVVSETATALTGLGLWPVLAGFGARLPVRRPYRAPELSATEVSAAGDRFALAALAYEWITGRRVPSAFVPGDMAPVPGGSREELALVFGRALHADPDRRHPSCGDFVEELAGVAAQVEPAEELPERRAGGGARRARADNVPLPLEAFPAEAEPGLPLAPSPDLALSSFADDEGSAGGGLDEDVAADEALLVAEPGEAFEANRGRPHVYASSTVSATGGWTDGRATAGWLAAAAGLGLALGIGIGYLVWGGHGVAERPAASEAPAGPTRAPLAIEDPQPVASQPASVAAGGTPKPAASPPAGTAVAPAVASGSLLIRSTPAGATVFVDDERRGVTPLTVTSIAFGTRVVRIQRDGFVADERRVTLSEDRPSRSVEVRLQRAAAAAAVPRPPTAPAATTGSLVVESRPAGAAVTVDGRPAGTTPLTLDGLPAGPHTVTIRLSGFRPVTTTVRVVAGERARAAASLTSVQEP